MIAGWLVNGDMRRLSMSTLIDEYHAFIGKYHAAIDEDHDAIDAHARAIDQTHRMIRRFEGAAGGRTSLKMIPLE